MDINETKSELQTQRVVIVSPSYLIVMSIFAVAILATNVISLVVMAISRKLRSNNHHVLVLFLGFSDIMVGVSLMVLLYSLMYDSFLDTKEGCTFVFSLLFSSLAASFLQMLLVCIERFIVIRFRYHLERVFEGKKKYIYLALIWFLSTLIITVYVVMFSKTKVEECGIRGIFDPQYQMQIVGFFFVIYVTTVAFYLYTLCRIRHITRRIHNMADDNHRQNLPGTTRYIEVQSVSRNPNLIPTQQAPIPKQENRPVPIGNSILNSSNAGEIKTINALHTTPMAGYGRARILQQRNNRTLRELSNNRFKLEKKATMTVGCFLGLATICVLPLTVVEALGQLKVFYVSGNLRIVVGSLFVLNSLFNPILFSVRIGEFRREVRRLIKCSQSG